MKRGVALLSGLLVVLVVGAARSADEPPKDAEYYPLKKGTTWTYKVNNMSLTQKVVGTEKIGDVECSKVEVFANDKSVATEHLAVGKDGIYRHSINGQKIDNPVCVLKLPVKDGDKWDVDSKAAGQAIKGTFTTKKDKVKVAAGEYDAILVEGKDFDLAGQKGTFQIWFAPKVGMVKQTVSVGGLSFTLELEKFEEGK